MRKQILCANRQCVFVYLTEKLFVFVSLFKLKLHSGEAMGVVRLKNWKVVLAVLTVNVTMMSSGYTMLIPFLPMYLVRELGVSSESVTMWNGAIFSITFLIGGIMAPIWGKMADTKGKKLMGIRSGAGLALSYFLGGLVTSPEQMFMVRVVQGFAAGLWSVCLAVATSLVPIGKLGVSLGIMQAGLTCGNVIGPLVGGTLATLFGMRTSFFVAGTLLSIITLVFAFYIPEPPKKLASDKPLADADSKAELLKRPLIREVLFYVALVQMLILLIQPVLSLYVEELSGGEGNVVFMSGFVFSLVGIAGAITAPAWGKFGQRKGFYRGLVLAALCSGVMSMVNALPETLTVFCVTNFTYGLCCSGIMPSLSAVIASHTERSQQGRAFGYVFSAQQFGSMLGPLLGGLIALWFPLRSLFVLCGIIMLLLSLFVFLKHVRCAAQAT